MAEADSKEEGQEGTAFLTVVPELRKQTATWARKPSPPPTPANPSYSVLKKPPLEYSEEPIPALVVHVSSVDSFYVHRYEDLGRHSVLSRLVLEATLLSLSDRAFSSIA